MKKLSLSLKPIPARRYPIWVGTGFLANIPAFFKKPTHAVLFFDPVLASESTPLQTALSKKGWRIDTIPVPGSESSKEFDFAKHCFAQLVAAKTDRSSVFFALGGGVVGDLVGFLAGSYMRGVPWVSIPTTLLAQVDSGLGGKTGINHPNAKNLIGLFNQPALVACDLAFLNGLGERDRVSGLGEIFKYALALDASFWKELARDWNDILALDPRKTEKAVARSLSWKAKIVAQDEREERGIRELLNLGHSVAHALEGAAGYGYFRHGEAVLWGMRVESALSHLWGKLPRKDFEQIDEVLSKPRVPAVPGETSFEKVADYIRRDKKNRGGKLRFVLPTKIGKAKLFDDVPIEKVREAFAYLGVRLR